MVANKKFKFNYIKKGIILLVLCFLMVVLVCYPNVYLDSCYKGITLWAVIVLPSLLPFFFLTALFTATGVLSKICSPLDKTAKTLFNLKGIAFYCFFMSILSGYPVGSKIISELYEKGYINEGESSRCAILASTSGPLFTIGAVGIAMFNSKVLGIIIYVCHVLGAFLTAILFRNYGKKPDQNFKLYTSNQVNNALYESMYSSVVSCLLVGGFISVFYVFAEIATNFNLLIFVEKLLFLPLKSVENGNGIAKAFTYGLIECTRGAKNLSLFGANAITVSLTTALCSFGGISIIMQSIVFLSKAKVKLKIFFLQKGLQMIISFVLSFISTLIFY